jgi:hypothetical protein
MTESTVPQRPVPEPSPKWRGIPFTLSYGFTRYSIGWMEYSEANGGLRYTVLRRNLLLAFTEVSTFPLTDEGWVDAWRVFDSLAPRTATQVRARIEHDPGSIPAR